MIRGGLQENSKYITEELVIKRERENLPSKK